MCVCTVTNVVVSTICLWCGKQPLLFYHESTGKIWFWLTANLKHKSGHEKCRGCFASVKSSCKLAMTWSISCMNINDTLFFCILSLTWSIKCKICRSGLAGVDNSTALGSTLIQLDKQQLRESVNSNWKCFHWNTQSKQNRGIGNKGSLPRL